MAREGLSMRRPEAKETATWAVAEAPLTLETRYVKVTGPAAGPEWA